jgi:hypothetical protein
MKPDDAEEYTQALGQVVAGGWRQIALGHRLGVPRALGLTVEQWVHQRLGGYVRLAISDRRQAVLELKAEGQKNTTIAAVLGVDEKTVRLDLTSENSDSRPANHPHSSEYSDAPTSEQLANLAAAKQHVANVRQQRADHPERFAADELFDLLGATIEHCAPWRPALHPSGPGTRSVDEWTTLLREIEELIDDLHRWHQQREEISV